MRRGYMFDLIFNSGYGYHDLSVTNGIIPMDRVPLSIANDQLV